MFDTVDGLYDCVWSEENENILVSACGDGSIKVGARVVGWSWLCGWRCGRGREAAAAGAQLWIRGLRGRPRSRRGWAGLRLGSISAPPLQTAKLRGTSPHTHPRARCGTWRLHHRPTRCAALRSTHTRWGAVAAAVGGLLGARSACSQRPRQAAASGRLSHAAASLAFPRYLPPAPLPMPVDAWRAAPHAPPCHLCHHRTAYVPQPGTAPCHACRRCTACTGTRCGETASCRAPGTIQSSCGTFR